MGGAKIPVSTILIGRKAASVIRYWSDIAVIIDPIIRKSVILDYISRPLIDGSGYKTTPIKA